MLAWAEEALNSWKDATIAIHAIAIIFADSAAAADLFYTRCPSLFGPVKFFDNSFHTLTIGLYLPDLVVYNWFYTVVLKYKIIVFTVV